MGDVNSWNQEKGVILFFRQKSPKFKKGGKFMSISLFSLGFHFVQS